MGYRIMHSVTKGDMKRRVGCGSGVYIMERKARDTRTIDDLSLQSAHVRITHQFGLPCRHRIASIGSKELNSYPSQSPKSILEN